MECQACEYEGGCFCILHTLHQLGYPCNQGRKRRFVPAASQATLPLESEGAKA